MAGKQLETVISLKGVLSKSVPQAFDSVKNGLQGIDAQAVATSAKIAASMAVIGAALVKAGTAAYKLGAAFDEAYDNIRIGTGATGKALDGLQEDFRAVYSEVPADMKQTSQAIADYNTRLGLSGETLRTVSKQALLLSNNLGAGDLGGIIKSSSTAMQGWNISADQMAGKMDLVFRASQSTGAGFSDIMGNLQAFGPALQDLGFSFDYSAAMIGQLEKNGLNTEEVLGAMKKSLGALAKQGISGADGIKQYWAEIKNAKTQTEAAAKAAEIFGTRAGPTMANAIRSNKMEFSELTKQLTGGGDTIIGLSWETMDAAEKFEILKHKIELAFEPLGGLVFDAANDFIEWLTPAIEQVTPAIKSLGEQAKPVFKEIGETIGDCVKWAKDFGAAISEHWGIVAPIIAGVSAALLAFTVVQYGAAAAAAVYSAAETVALVGLYAWEAAATIGTVVTTALGAAFAFLTSPIGLIILAIGAVVAIGVALYMNWTTIMEYASILGSYLASIWASIAAGVGSACSSIASFFSGAFAAAGAAVSGFVGGAIAGINSVISAINGISISIPDWVPVFGGNTWSPSLPTFAQGGFTDGASIAGEAGREAVISFNSQYRAANIGYLAQAAALLGIGTNNSATESFNSKLSALAGTTLSGASNKTIIYDLGGIMYSPTVTINGSGSNEDTKKDIMQQLKQHSAELMDMLQDMQADKELGNYGNGGVF